MKKIICLLLMLILCLGCFAACGKDDGNEDTGNNGGDTTPTKTTAEEAKELLFAMYKDESSTTQADYEVVGVIKVGDKTCNIVWTVDVTSGVTVGAINDNKMVPVDVDEEAGADIAYKLTATITDAEGNTATVVLDRVVPKFQVNTLEEYLNAKKGDSLVVEGIITAINSKSAGNKRNHLFLADASGKGGYYIYQMDQDPVADLNLKVGMTVRVAGPAEPYSGMMEMKGGAVTKVIDTTEKTVEAVDITEEFLKETPNFAPYVGMLVTVKGVTLGNQELGGTSEYLFFTKGNIKSYLRTYVTDLPTSVKEADKATIDALHASKTGYNADVTGIVVLYSGAPYLMPVSAEPFTNINLPERTDEEKVDFEIGSVEVVTSVNKDTTVQLPLAGVTYPDTVTFSWTVDNNKFTITENGTLEIKLGSDAVKLTLTLTATCGDVTKTKTFEINVAANKVMSTTKPYYGFLNQVKAKKQIWLDGGVDGRYLTTTEDPTKAVAIYAEKAADGYKFYIVVDDVKQYITLYKNEENNDSLKYDAEGTTTYNYNPTVNAWMINGTGYYLGTYNNFTTVSASTASYLTPENSGVENFPLEFDFTLPGAASNMAVAQNNATVNKVIYVTGADDGRYLVTTENVAEAAVVYAEKVAGGFKFYIVVEEAKLYLTVYKNDADKDAVKFAADGNSVFNYDGATNALVTDFNGTKYYIGTYSTYTTLSASKFSYINAENTGVSQFPVELVAVGGSVTPDNPPVDPEDPTDPENPGDTPTIPVEPPVGEDVVTTYVGTDSFDGQFLTVVINETKKTVTYTYAHPMMGTTTVTYNYTVAEDGTVSLTKEDGTAVVALEASLTLTEGVPTAATYNGTDYTLSVNGESEELTEKDLLGSYVIGENEALIIYDEEGDKYLLNIWAADYSFDSYYTFVATFNEDGTATLALTHTTDFWMAGSNNTDTLELNGTSITVTVPTSIGGGEEGGPQETDIMYPFLGFHEVEGNDAIVYYDYDNSDYYLNIFGEGFDNYYSFVPTLNEDGTVTLLLTCIRDHWALEEGANPDALELDGKTVTLSAPVSDEPTLPDVPEAALNLLMGEAENYAWMIYYDYEAEVFYFNAFGDGFDNYYTFVATFNEDGTADLVLTCVRDHWMLGEDANPDALSLDGTTVKVTVPAEEDEEGDIYVGTDAWGNANLTVEIVEYSEIVGVVTFTFTNPMGGEPTVATYDYVIVDGVVSLYDADLEPVSGAALTMTDGVFTGASWNGTDYTFATEEDDDSNDVIKVYTSVMESPRGNYTLTVTVNETKGTVTFEETNPVFPMPTTMVFNYTIVDGAYVLTDDMGVVDSTVMAIVVTDGVVTAAVCNGNEYPFATEGGNEEPAVDPQDQIVKDAYALGADEFLNGKTLTGIIISVDEAYSTKYENITVTIIVNKLYDMPIKCYRLKGTGADTIKVGDTITVSGNLTNYKGKEIEFNTGCTLDNVKTEAINDATIKLIITEKETSVKSMVTADSVITLPVAGTTCGDVAIEWVSDNACAVVAGDKLTVTLQATAQVVKLTATYKIGEISKTVEYTVNVNAKPVASNTVATFEFGENDSTITEHKDTTSAFAENQTYTDGTYTLTLTNLSKVYGNCFDAKGNCGLKFGTNSVAGTMTFTVPADVDQVVIKVAQYKNYTTKINVNGTEYSIETASDDGAYTDIIIDTSENKTVTFTTVSGGLRCMVTAVLFEKKSA